MLEIQKLRDEAMLAHREADKWISIATSRAVGYGDMAWAVHRHLADLRSIEKVAVLEVEWQRWYQAHSSEVQYLIDAEREHREGLGA